MIQEDTIAAIATAEGAGGIAIIRVSGEQSLPILRRVFSKKGAMESHRMYHGYIQGAQGVVDEVMAVYMRAPKTYTREDVCEIYCHGGRVAARRALKLVLDAGARAAAPGEFTKRAFLNGRIDLSQAEAVMQLIGAHSEVSARAAVRQLRSGASSVVKPVIDAILGMLALLEASTDFPDEVEEEASKDAFSAGARDAIARLDALIDARGARILREGASVVLAGRPNVGKSSILNALIGSERAIVTDIPGTTRDVITERVEIGGTLIELSDTAGLRDTGDAVEKIGVRRAQDAAETADVVIAVLDAHEGLTEGDMRMLAGADARHIACINKRDLGENIRAADIEDAYGIEAREVSARTGAGIDELIGAIAARIDVGDVPLVTERHIELAKDASRALHRALDAIGAGFELDICAIDIADALSSLTQITGENAREAVIDRIFQDFCVGK
ncbi:MAG: tRNA uridine-5-carboxymethylaminomethyl(34) synthesis GTPase MnmE [Christensenellales bacterium]|jgi:tRNA modification GTPase